MWSKPIADVLEGQPFYYAGRKYLLATKEDSAKHPALGCGQVLAYYVPARGDRVPVSFASTARVFV